MPDELQTDAADPSVAWVDPTYTAEPSTTIFSSSKQTWKWSVFGGDLMVVCFTDCMKQPSWRQRFLSRLLLGSVWTRLDKEKT